jgi:tellurite resistance protein TerC
MLPWVGFILFIMLMLALDLGFFNRKVHVISLKEALAWFGVWIGLALLFNVGVVVFHERGVDAGLEFFAGYLVEKSLSIDNVFVFILIFHYFQVPTVHQHKVLAMGILGAIVLRIAFILGGIALLERFHWTIYVFGAFLVATGLIMFFRKETKFEPENNWIILAFMRYFPFTNKANGGRFWDRIDGRWKMTPILVALLAIESSDIIFALDSIPAIFAITTDPFIVFTSNIFAMLGLRALYFAVQSFMKMFHLLHYGFAMIIAILGLKMLLDDVYKVPISISLFLIVLILLVCAIVSLLRPRKEDLKLLFERTEQLGLIPFRRLLLIENIVHMGELSVIDSMRCRAEVKVIRLDIPWDENIRMMKEHRFSRYPLVERVDSNPIGVVHIKNLQFADPQEVMSPTKLRGLARGNLEFLESLTLEDALERFQRKYDRLSIVYHENGEWVGILTFEDLIQEIIGNMGDEFDQARTGDFISLADTLTPELVILDLKAESITSAVRIMVAKMTSTGTQLASSEVVEAVLRRKQAMPIFVGNGLAIPHGRLSGISRPILVFARCDVGVPVDDSSERAEIIFLLITPINKPKMQARMLANINALFKSEYVAERLQKAQTPEMVIEAIRAGQQVALD